MKTIEITPTNTDDIEKLEAGTCIDLSAADMTALRNLRELTRGQPSEWLDWGAFFTDGWYQYPRICQFLTIGHFLGQTNRYRLNEFGYFILDLADGIAYIRLEVD